jgi:hypothetical protein
MLSLSFDPPPELERATKDQTGYFNALRMTDIAGIGFPAPYQVGEEASAGRGEREVRQLWNR